MSQNAFITFVEGSTVNSLTVDELKQELLKYKEQFEKTGQQLGWEYADNAFPYTIEAAPDGSENWFYLKGKNELYKHIVFGVGSKEEDGTQRHYIQVVLPDDCTHGDKSKGNEFCKYLAKKFQAELRMFNGRTMYFNPRK